MARAAAYSHDLEGLARPLLEALAKLGDLDSTYLSVFDWDRREQEVRFLHSSGPVEVTDGTRLPLPDAVSRETLPGVTRSPGGMDATRPDSEVAKELGLATYVSVPIVLADHELYGMVCGASRQPQAVVGGPVITVMELFAQIIADYVARARVAATERRAEVAEEQLRSRGHFLAAAEHQLKTPLTSVKGAAQILRDNWADLGEQEREQFLDMVLRGTDHLSRDITSLLVEARADVQSRDLLPVELDLAGLARAITRAFDALSSRHHVRSEVEEGLTAWADPAAIYQVLGHLLDNAIKYSPAGGVIRVVGRRTPDGVDIAVVDEGVGLPEGIDIFEAFQRGDPAVAGATPGVGLGLHIVRGLVEATGGSVEGETNACGGSTFTVILPRE